jgi:hypothetical protein
MKAARGTYTTFTAEFLDLDGEPLVPADPETTPTIQIKNPQEEVFATAIGSTLGSGKYNYRWYVPKDVELNVPDQKWGIDWFFIALGNQTKSATEYFDIIDKVEPTPEERKQTYISLPGKSERVFFRSDLEPEEVTLEIYDPGNQLTKSVVGFTEDGNLTKTDDPNRIIGKRDRDSQYIFWYDTDVLTEGEYLLFWGVRDTIDSPKEYEQQVLRVPHLNFWRLNKPLLMVIDKLQKKAGWVQSYSDADILEYVQRGLGLVNMIRPNTDWTLGTIPTGGNTSSGIFDAVLLAATIRALEAQQILEIELSFSHSGQTVTLDYNHDYGGVMSNIRDQLTIFQEAKERLYRVACGPGVTGVRPKSFRYGQRVYRLTSDGSSPAAAYDPSNMVARIFT